MGSDHAPVMCTFGFNKDFRLDLTEAEPRFNFTKADWGLFGSTLDGMITEIKNENLNDIKSFDGVFSNLIKASANGAIPKFAATTLKSYP
ncbi:hypothetical protein BpHYR1_000848 [Brachionus plicatilis]|uniref:Uncharacterized protein n=1 Tax=Brachionus plicatilis TaxID=10195 RepID=A0A3M7RBT2_BRAPC|nr:hypothetical protein BpHYR1_000848 [Brachionus plicatilis]